MTQNQSPGWRRCSSSSSFCSVIIIFCLAAFYSLMCFQIHHQITIVEILLPFEGLSGDENSCGLFLTFCDHVMLLCFRRDSRGRNWVPVKNEEWGYYIAEWDVASVIFFQAIHLWKLLPNVFYFVLWLSQLSSPIMLPFFRFFQVLHHLCEWLWKQQPGFKWSEPKHGFLKLLFHWWNYFSSWI